MKLLVVFGVVFLACIVHGGELSIPHDVDTRVVGGNAAQRGQFPHILSMIWCLLIFCQHICGASILTPTAALTAAHCITEVPGIGSFSVRAGHHLQNDPSSIGQQVSVASSVVHPNYAGGVNPNDIAILNLASGLIISATIQPIQLPVPGSVPTGVATLAGWGSVSNTTQQIMPNELQFIGEKEILTLANCAEDLIFLFGTSSPLADSNVCTGGTGLSACSGDSGGPLSQGDVIIGVVSWGVVPCGFPRAPSVYTRVSAFNSWINSLT